MSRLYALTVPKWGMSMEEGEISEWLVSVGDRVSVGDEIVDIETSKIVNTAESTCDGTLVRIVAQPGEVHKVATLLGVVADGDVSDAEIDEFVASFRPDAAALNRPLVGDSQRDQQTDVVSTADQPVPSQPGSLSEGPDDSSIKASVIARRLAREHNINLNNVVATGRNGQVSKWDVEKAAGINNQPLTSSGSQQRVVQDDVEHQAGSSQPMTPSHEIQLSGMRKIIAERLTESKQSIPHYRVSVDIVIDSLLQQRQYMNAELGHSLSVNDFVIKAAASALQKVPAVNVQFSTDSILQFDQVDISMAVAVDGGLITPVIRNVGAKDLIQISQEARDLATRAKQGNLSIDDFQGGTFSISNLGMFGVDQFDAIINVPQAAILAVAAGVRKPVVEDDRIVPATVMRVTLSSDHRAIDGAVAAEFLQELKGLLENPEVLMS